MGARVSILVQEKILFEKSYSCLHGILHLLLYDQFYLNCHLKEFKFCFLNDKIQSDKENFNLKNLCIRKHTVIYNPSSEPPTEQKCYKRRKT